jgi:hypothetical protein
MIDDRIIHSILDLRGTVQGAVATWSLPFARLAGAPGRYHSLYHTGRQKNRGRKNALFFRPLFFCRRFSVTETTI